jgi:acetylornithine deacetylase/succinyl-diaminopimelate desuccinylase-like protein
MTSPKLEPVFAWIDAQREAAIADLQRYCRQPSIAAQGVGMEEMAAIVAADLRELGADTALVATAGYPVAVGRLDGDSPRRVMIYNHYDVQPPEPLEEWRTPPFEAAIEDGVLYARGVADNKGNVVARMWAARAWLAVHGSLPCGVTFVFEGEEEIGSPHLGLRPPLRQRQSRTERRLETCTGSALTTRRAGQGIDTRLLQGRAPALRARP